MSALGSWILGITAAALSAALAQALTPEGTVKKIGKVMGGLVLVLAMLRPLAVPDLSALEEELSGVWEQQTSPAPDGGEEVLKILIARKAGAYIVDKGRDLGCGVTEARVTAADDGSGWPVPWSAEIRGSWSKEGRKKLEKAVEEDLNIPAARQSYLEEGAEEEWNGSDPA